MARIIGLCGSLRQGSFNAMLLRAAIDAAPAGTTIVPAPIREIPLYDGDLEEEQGLPSAVTRLKDEIAASDGVLIATPEYNHSLPGVLKNAIDWLSRPGDDIPRVFGGCPVATMGATIGMGGTLLSQAAWLPVVRKLGMRPWCEGTLFVSNAADIFDLQGRVVDSETRQRIHAFVNGFAAFVSEQLRHHVHPVPAAVATGHMRTPSA